MPQTATACHNCHRLSQTSTYICTLTHLQLLRNLENIKRTDFLDNSPKNASFLSILLWLIELNLLNKMHRRENCLYFVRVFLLQLHFHLDPMTKCTLLQENTDTKHFIKALQNFEHSFIACKQIVSCPTR